MHVTHRRLLLRAPNPEPSRAHQSNDTDFKFDGLLPAAIHEMCSCTFRVFSSVGFYVELPDQMVSDQDVSFESLHIKFHH